jgi:hypothetical protein
VNKKKQKNFDSNDVVPEVPHTEKLACFTAVKPWTPA